MASSNSSTIPVDATSPAPALTWSHCTLALVKPDAFPHAEAITDIARESGFSIVARHEIAPSLSRERAELFYTEHSSRPFFPSLVDFMTSGPILALVLRRDDLAAPGESRTAVAEWRKLIGPTDSDVARKDSPDSIRAKFGKDLQRNAVHGSDSTESAEREIKFFFPSFDPAVLSASQSKDYLMAKVAPALSAALAELCRVTPQDPIDWLGKYLISANPAAADRKKIFFVLGGPGSGKGTQCAKLVEEYKFAHFSAGDLLRAEVASGSTDGQLIDGLIKEGKIVPGEITIGLLKKAIETTPARGVLIDGFPRKLDQAGAFEKEVSDFECVIFFDCPEDVMEQRLLKRGETSGRTDDNIDSIRKRFRTFVETSMPVVEYYSSKGKVHKFDATQTPDEVFEMVKSKIRQYVS